ncbi:MAG: glutamine synthetase beta-grasp domain-containing protein [Bacilli bacterium]
MEKTKITIKEEILRNKLQSIRLLFCDIDGNLKGIEYSTYFIDRILDEEISIDGSSINGFQSINVSPLYLKPDYESFQIIESEEDEPIAIIFCYLLNIDKTIHPCDTRNLLKDIVLRNKKENNITNINVSFEFEFYLLDENNNPIDEGSYLDIGIKDKGYEFRKYVTRKLNQFGYQVEASHHECGKGQQEIHYIYKDVLEACDRFLLLKYLIELYALKYNVKVDFSPKPFSHLPGNGLHINISCWNNNSNLFFDSMNNKSSSLCLQFVHGILSKMQSMFYVLNRTFYSYYRLNDGGETPKEIDYSLYSRKSLIRVIESSNDTSRIEIRNPDAFINPYLAISLILSAGFKGINENRIIKTRNKKIPTSLKEAYLYFSKSIFIKDVLNNELFNQLLIYK